MRLRTTLISQQAFGLIQALVVLSLIGIVASIAVPATRDAMIAQRGKSSTENLRIIETAKRQFTINNPGAELTGVADLLEWLPNGQLPEPIHRGEIYNIGNLSTLATSSVNGLPEFEPWHNKGPLESNAHNDLGAASPVVVHMPVVVTPVPEGNLRDLEPNDSVNQIYYDVTVLSAGNGTVSVGGQTPTKSYMALDTATINAIPYTGYYFDKWKAGSDEWAAEENYSFQVTRDITLTAEFLRQPVTLTVASTHLADFNVDGNSETGLSTKDFSFFYGDSVPVEAIDGPAKTRFTGWTNAITSNSAAVSVTMNGNRTLQANFINTWDLTVATRINGVDCVTCGDVTPARGTHTYDTGTSVQMTAISATGYRFTGWSGNLTGTTSPQNVSMTSDKTVVANFVENSVVIVTSSTDVVVPEGSSVSTVTVWLSDEPTGAVTVTLNKTNEADAHLSSQVTELYFTPGNYAVPQTITFSAAEDDDNMVNGSARFMLESSRASGSYVDVSEVDDDYVLNVTVSPVGAGTVDKTPEGTEDADDTNTPKRKLQDGLRSVGLVAAPVDSAQYVFKRYATDISSTAASSSVTMNATVDTDGDKIINVTAMFGCFWVLGTPGEWSECTDPCGNGTRTRTTPYVSSVDGCLPDTPQPANSVETEACTGTGIVKTWVLGTPGEWSACSVCTGPGTQTRTTPYIESAGDCPPTTPKPADLVETQACSGTGVVRTWILGTPVDGPCSVECGTGTTTRTTPYIESAGDCSPTTPKPADLVEPGLPCVGTGAPKTWVLGTPGEWSDCSVCATDETGTQTRTTPYVQSAEGVCPPVDARPADYIETIGCNGVGTRKTWVLGTPSNGPCSVECGPGTMTRTTPYVLSATGTCPPLTAQPPDYVEPGLPCTGTGVVGTWQTGEWSTCNCDNMQFRTVTLSPPGSCPPAGDPPADSQSCTPTGSWVVGEWTWGLCFNGNKSGTRTVIPVGDCPPEPKPEEFTTECCDIVTSRCVNPGPPSEVYHDWNNWQSWICDPDDNPSDDPDDWIKSGSPWEWDSMAGAPPDDTATWVSKIQQRDIDHYTITHTYTSLVSETITQNGNCTIIMRGFQCNYTSTYNYTDSPIILDVFGIGYPDTLNPTREWKKGNRKVDFFTTRKIDLDASGVEKNWEWVGNKAGVLVWSKTSVLPEKLTGISLFGTKTWGKVWAHGYEPLATLDCNDDGFLTGDEMENIFIWVDSNTDAVCQPGEYTPLAGSVEKLAVRAHADDNGNASIEKTGALMRNGSWVSSWDWWSSEYAYPSVLVNNEIVPCQVVYPSTEKVPSATIYKWTITKSQNLPASMPESTGGYLRFFKRNGAVMVWALGSVEFSKNGLISGSFSQIAEKEHRLAWKTPATQAKLLPNGNISGTTRTRGGYYTWEAEPVLNGNQTGDPLLATIGSISDASLEKLNHEVRVYFQPTKDGSPEAMQGLATLLD